MPGNAGFSSNEIDIEVESAKGGSNTWPFFVNICPAGERCQFTP